MGEQLELPWWEELSQDDTKKNFMQPALVAGDDEADEDDLRRRIAEWARDNADPVDPELWIGVLREEFGPERVGSDGRSLRDVAFSFQKTLWDRFGIIPNGSYLGYSTPRDDIPHWVRAALGILGVPATTQPRRTKEPLSGAFMVLGNPGLGRINTSQFTHGLMQAICGDKAGWDTTDPYWPRYSFSFNEQEIAYTIEPENPVPRGTEEHARQLASAHNTLKKLDFADLDVLIILMIEAMETFNIHNPGRDPNVEVPPTRITADTILARRGFDRRKDKDGYSGGYQPLSLDQVSESMNHLGSLHVSTKTLQRLVPTRGKPRVESLNYTAKLLNVSARISADGKTIPMAWEYRLGKWFYMFSMNPNNFVGYMWQLALTWNAWSEKAAKGLAYYLFLEMRRNARSADGEVRRSIGALMHGACIKVGATNQDRARKQFEDAVRAVVRAGLFRLRHGDVWLCGPSPAIDTWTMAHDLPYRGWIKVYQERMLDWRPDPIIDQIYAEHVRHDPRLGTGTPPMPKRTHPDSD